MEEGEKTSRTGKIVIVAVVVLLAAAAFALKDSGKPAQETASGETTSHFAVAEEGPEGALPKLVDLGQDSCIPCKMMAPLLEELKVEYAGKLEVVVIDLSVTPEAAREYGVRIIPLQVFYDAAGNELFRHEGFYSKEDIVAKWKELGVDLSGGDS